MYVLNESRAPQEPTREVKNGHPSQTFFSNQKTDNKMIDFDKVTENESRRATPEQARTIYLYPEGTFLRAFEWSAWLWCKYITDFKPMRRKLKNSDASVVQIGCPISSFDKHLPEDAAKVYNEDGTVVVTLSPAAVADDTDTEAMSDEVEEWKNSVAFAPVNARQKPDNSSVARTYAAAEPRTSITGVMQQILAFPIEKKSFLECALFLSDIKAQLAHLI